MKSADYLFLAILLLLFVGVQYIFAITLTVKEPAYVEITFNEPYIKNVNVEIHNANVILRIPIGGQTFDNCSFLIDGGNLQITGAGLWQAK